MRTSDDASYLTSENEDIVHTITEMRNKIITDPDPDGDEVLPTKNRFSRPNVEKLNSIIM